ncbi:MAG: Na+-transporting NADH:ubiquinone oxidoreductase subunit D [Bacteroidia bacterium]|jgi:Na+-transporting NADH:ubiquinone oxidoreductase subunit D
MSTEAQAVEAEVKEREPLFSKKNRKLISNPLDADNPITVQVLGVCSALAVTVKLIPTLYMCVSVLFVLIFSNVAISMLRNVIPGRIRIIVQLLVVASLVAVVDQVLQAYAYSVSKQLSVFVGLIITNCIIMGRLEAFALANKPGPAMLDAIGNGLGYAAILIPVAFFRELLGSGSLFGFNILGENYPGNGVMMSPVGACIVLGLLIWFQRSRNGYTEEA